MPFIDAHLLSLEIPLSTVVYAYEGPILRRAVRSALDKRQMTYTLQSGGGAFVVDAASGFELYDEGQGSDTKVIVVPRVDNGPDIVGGTQKGTLYSSKYLSRRTSFNSSISSSGYDVNNRIAPLPSEVSADDALLDKAKSISSVEASKAFAAGVKERNDVNKVVSESLDEKHRLDSERRELERTMELSMEEARFDCLRQQKEEEELERIVALSLNEREQDVTCIEQELQRALNTSPLILKGWNLDSAVSKESEHVDLDEETKKAIKDSLAIVHQRIGVDGDMDCEEDNDLRQALKQSLESCHIESSVSLPNFSQFWNKEPLELVREHAPQEEADVRSNQEASHSILLQLEQPEIEEEQDGGDLILYVPKAETLASAPQNSPCCGPNELR